MMRSWAVFESPVQNGLHTLKYKHNIGLGEALANQMVEFMTALQWNIDALIPVPLGKKRLKERGYNQVALVARPLAYQAGLAYMPDALRKARETRSQVGLNVNQRHENVKNVYQADANRVMNKSIVVMDDVSTTGSTILSCTDALLAAGAREVYAITIARALSHHDLNRV
jgi:ComF family protein